MVLCKKTFDSDEIHFRRVEFFLLKTKLNIIMDIYIFCMTCMLTRFVSSLILFELDLSGSLEEEINERSISC